MLAPETRLLLTDALRPPEGFRVDVAVGTTYSLDLHAMLLAPLSFALHDVQGAAIDEIDPIRLLESVRRYAACTTVFCQAGAIHVPRSYRRILAFAEDTVREVVAPTDRRIFHPKIWALRFVDRKGNRSHRFLCLSRNLTLDRSWDTLLRLDEAERSVSTPGPDPSPITEFLAALPGLATTPLEPGRVADIESLASSIKDAAFALPVGVHDLRFVPLGLTAARQWPFPEQARRAVAISAFVDASIVARLTTITAELRIVSRQESLDGLCTIPAGGQLFTLARFAETDEDAEQAADGLGHEGKPPPDGLHAKTFILDLAGDRSLIVTGSANATSAGFGGNVEFVVAMEAARDLGGVSASWDGAGKDVPGLARLCEPYTPVMPDETQAKRVQLEREIEYFHAELAAQPLRLLVSALEENRYALTLAPVHVPDFGETTVRPLSLPAEGFARPMLGEPSWEMAMASITPYLVVTTSAAKDGVTARRQATIKGVLEGDPPERTTRILEEILKNPRDVLRYLVFLLGDPSYEDWFGTGEGTRDWERFGLDSGTRADLAIFEPMVKAVARGDDSIERISSLLAELRALPNAGELLPDGLEDLWAAVWQAHAGDPR
jgi:hypothetical protein